MKARKCDGEIIEIDPGAGQWEIKEELEQRVSDVSLHNAPEPFPHWHSACVAVPLKQQISFNSSRSLCTQQYINAPLVQ